MYYYGKKVNIMYYYGENKIIPRITTCPPLSIPKREHSRSKNIQLITMEKKNKKLD